ncbi:hypothetical protein HBI38_057730 [Parastagonospora nodorum]|nr:hypothetical protein HBH92_111640 [Parastagonospora nodorum]KAH4545906.1 hypothetical protein HBH85_079840 [Parastagonospora nodorum]KAH4556259.1 hypothetical protein HBH86_094860 [Parastagonospora nodorum]KAH4865966.1 hypothetical protein HBH59_158800 [Parastagonospora nodorum]KAH4876909.1 hypothetical protein HBH58_104350 [Parastagonospora nodorum]
MVPCLSIRFPALPDLGLFVVALVRLRFSYRLLVSATLSIAMPIYLSPSMTPVTNALPSPTSMPPTPFILTPPPASSTSTPLLSFAILTSLSPLRSFLTLSGSSKSSDAASSSISPISSQWYGNASGAASAVLSDKNGGESLQSLAWYHRDKLHFAQERYLWRRQPRWKRQCHACDALS